MLAMAKDKVRSGGERKGARDEVAPISDARFAKMQSDPRFLNVPTKKKKVIVDDRFKVRVPRSRALACARVGWRV